MSEEERRRRSTFWRPGEGETERKLETERGEERTAFFFFLSLCLHPSPVSNTELVKLHGPNWTNDWAQIRPALMNK